MSFDRLNNNSVRLRVRILEKFYIGMYFDKLSNDKLIIIFIIRKTYRRS